MPVALAAKPKNQACLGEDFSGYAHDGVLFPDGAAFGGFIAGVIAPGGAGDEIQAHLAGEVPDASPPGIPNSCND